jgi:hypothetical protein
MRQEMPVRAQKYKLQSCDGSDEAVNFHGSSMRGPFVMVPTTLRPLAESQNENCCVKPPIAGEVFGLY